MPLAMSNIAWDPGDDDIVARVLRDAGFAGVELAPTKWRADPTAATAAEIAALRRAWDDRGLSIAALQALLFGRPDLQLFGDPATRRALGDYTMRMIDLAVALGARALVFGSPKNRVRGALAMSDALRTAADFFTEIGAYAVERGAALCVEANPVAYGCDFLTTTAEAAALCRRVASDGVRVNIDMGGITLADERPVEAIAAAAGIIGHVHASEPQLAPLSSGAGGDHRAAAAALTAIRYGGWVSVEMRSATLPEITEAARFAASVYGTDAAA